MEKVDVFEKLGKKEAKAEDMAESAIKNPDLLSRIFNGISLTNARIRYSWAKILKIISEEKPEALYPIMDFFSKLLHRDKRILKWNALIILANLARVDVENKFDDILGKYYGLLNSECMVTVANVVGNSAKIARAKPYLTQKITNELPKVEKSYYKITSHSRMQEHSTWSCYFSFQYIF